MYINRSLYYLIRPTSTR